MVLSGNKERWIYQHASTNIDLLYGFKSMVGMGGEAMNNTKMTRISLTFNGKGVLINKKFGY